MRRKLSSFQLTSQKSAHGSVAPLSRAGDQLLGYFVHTTLIQALEKIEERSPGVLAGINKVELLTSIKNAVRWHRSRA